MLRVCDAVGLLVSNCPISDKHFGHRLSDLRHIHDRRNKTCMTKLMSGDYMPFSIERVKELDAESADLRKEARQAGLTIPTATFLLHR